MLRRAVQGPAITQSLADSREKRRAQWRAPGRKIASYNAYRSYLAALLHDLSCAPVQFTMPLAAGQMDYPAAARHHRLSGARCGPWRPSGFGQVAL